MCANGTCEPDTGLCFCDLGWTGSLCETEGQIIALDLVDTEGESVIGAALKVDGRWVDLPGAVTVVEGASLNASHVYVCNGERTLTGDPIIPQADTTWMYDIATHSQSSNASEGETAVYFVLEQPYKPVAWFNFEDATTSGTLRRDIVDGWMSQNAIDVTQQVPGVVGNAIDWAPDNDLTLQYYARLNSSTGDIFGKDASWEQRDWLEADSFTIEILFENATGFILGTRPRFFELIGRFSLKLLVNLITLYAGGETITFSQMCDGLYT